MDLLASQGEISPKDIAELSAMSKDELIALVSGMNRSWYQLLARLEDAHRQDLSQLEAHLTERYQEAVAQLEDGLTSRLDGDLRSIRFSENATLGGLQTLLANTGKEFSKLHKASSENGKKLESLKSALDGLTRKN